MTVPLPVHTRPGPLAYGTQDVASTAAMVTGAFPVRIVTVGTGGGHAAVSLDWD